MNFCSATSACLSYRMNDVSSYRSHCMLMDFGHRRVNDMRLLVRIFFLRFPISLPTLHFETIYKTMYTLSSKTQTHPAYLSRELLSEGSIKYLLRFDNHLPLVCLAYLSEKATESQSSSILRLATSTVASLSSFCLRRYFIQKECFED